MTSVLEKIESKQAWVMIIVLFFSLANPSLPAMASFYIAGDLGAGVETASWGAALSLLGVVITKPLGIILSRKVGRFNLLKICICANLLTNLIIVATSGYYFYLTVWFIHGLVTGPTYLLVLTSLKAHGNKDKVPNYVQLVLSSLIVAPVFGAATGAIIAYQYHWKIAFMIFSAIYIVCIFYLFTWFKGVELPLENIPIDWVTYGSYALGLSSLGFCLTTGLIIDGFRSLAFNIVFIIGLISFTYFLVRNHFYENPVIDWKVGSNSVLLAIMTIIALLVFTFHFAIIVLLSHWLHLYVNYSLNWICWILIINLIGPIILFFALQFKASQKIHFSISISMLTMIFLSFYISKFNVDINIGRIIMVRFFAGISMAMFLPATIIKIQQCCKEDAGQWATAIFSISKSFGSFLGVAFFSVLWNKRSVFFHSRLGESLTAGSENTDKVLNTLNFFNFSKSMKLEGLNDALERQSRALALDSCFYLIAISMTVLMVIYVSYILIHRDKELKTEKAT